MMKATHFLLAKDEQPVRKAFPEALVATVDGGKTTTIKAFLSEIGEVMHFPDYEGKNLEELDEMLNDLEWIDEPQVIIYINRTGDWLSKEKSEEKILTVLDLFDATAEDWEWLDEDDEEVSKKDFRIVFQDSPRIRQLLESQEIPFGEID
jgi:RNAse (barnase) inhibitor barstar